MKQEDKLAFLLDPNLGVLAAINQALVDHNFGIEWIKQEEFTKQYGRTSCIIRLPEQ